MVDHLSNPFALVSSHSISYELKALKTETAAFSLIDETKSKLY